MNLSVGEYLRARRMRGFGLTDAEIASKLCGHTAEQVSKALAPSDRSIRKPRPSRAKVKRVRVKTPNVPANNGEIGLRAGGVTQPHKITVPMRVIDERERAMATPRSLTAVVFGDPAPGRSALDRKRGIRP